MSRRYAATAVAALLTCIFGVSTGSSFAAAARHLPGALAAERVAHPANTLTVTNRSGGTIHRYPLQFGRPFVEGAIPHAPRVLLNGRPIPTQADVKNRYPGGSVEFAIIAVVIPELRPDVKQVLAFEDTTGNRNTPLSKAEMLDPSYNFDATMQLAGGSLATPAKLATATNLPGGCGANAWGGVRNGGFSITLNGRPIEVTGLNFTRMPSNCGWQDVLKIIRARLPRGLTVVQPGGAAGDGFVFQTTARGAGATLSYLGPPANGTDLSSAAYLGGTAALASSLAQGKAANRVVGTASARTMLQNGDYKLWTSGPVAQTIILADDTPTRKYDIGFGDGHHPFRPRFIATFWPATHQVFVRAVGENGLSTELEDIGPYSLTLTAANARIYTNPAITQPAMTTWTKEFWLPGSGSGTGSGTPSPQVDIDSNLAYLESTRFVPNYDPSITIGEATIGGNYANWWTNTGHDIGGSGAWQPGMGATGARSDIGPEPSWDVAWLYTGDWRMRQTALGNADLAAWWPVNVRETDRAAIVNRGDASGAGYGQPISISYRTYLGPSNGGEADFLNYNSDNSNPPNKLIQVGTVSINAGNGGDALGWQFDAAHEPSPFFIPYVLTGDPFYLQEMENWAAYDATEQQGGAGSNNQGRGPTGVEGGASDQERGDGWTIRSRAEAAFAIPDGDPFKTYLTTLMNDLLARWEGAMCVTGTVYDGSAEKTWAEKTGNPEILGGNPVQPCSPIGQWQANGNSVQGFISQAETNSNLSAYNVPWMEHYIGYSLGRAYELGFVARGLLNFVGEYETGLINKSGYPDLIANYVDPSFAKNGAWIASWPAYVRTYEKPFLTGNGYTGGSTQGSVPQQFGAPGVSGGEPEMNNQGYDAYAWAAMAGLVNAGVPGAAQAESWLKTNVHDVIGAGWAADPSWDIVPRTDHNPLPAQPTR